MHYTIDLVLFQEDNITAEVEVYFECADRNTDASDWDYRDYWEITNYLVFSNGKEIDLEIDSEYLYSKVKQKLRHTEVDIDLGN